MVKIERKKEILKTLNLEIERLRNAVTDARNLAISFSDASPSQSGDRANYELAADLAVSSLTNLEALHNEVIKTSERIATRIVPVCYVEIDYGDNDIQSILVANTAVRFSDFMVITPQSIVGQAISGKTAGDIVEYSINSEEDPIICKILCVE